MGVVIGVVSLFRAAAFAQDTAAPGPPDTDLPPLGTGPSVQLQGVLGGYPMERDSSGTSWAPQSTTMDMIHGVLGDWSTMLHGYAFGVYDHQGGPRGADKLFSENMLMGMVQRSLGDGTLSLRGMFSLDPLMGKNGYPLLLQTGETANGVTPLTDRQHPHNLFMELAGIYSQTLAADISAFLYAGYPGEPALGPPTFMHRFSGIDNPEAPISHHWLDSTHITYGVVTAGAVSGDWKIEGSIFNGREPDQYRWGFNPLRLDSESVRLSWNPGENWAFQVSYGFLKSPEQLEPNVDQHRTTTSAIYNKKLEHGNWQTTLAWGLDDNEPGHALNAWMLESAVSWYRHTVFARAENVDKDELFLEGNPLFEHVFDVSKLSVGYLYDIPVAEHLSLGIGGLGSVYALPASLKAAYGAEPLSYMLFTRVKLI